MLHLDSPVLAGRTPRELALVAIGGFGVLWGAVGSGPYGWQWSVSWAIVTGLFAARAWPARGVAVGACLAALAQWVCVSELRAWPWIVNVPVVALALLCSRDLAARFEEAPSRVRWLPNPWATIPRADARRLRWCAYAVGVLAAVLGQMWMEGANTFPATPGVILSLAATVALLAVGRAAALLPVVAIGGVAFAGLVRCLWAGTPYVDGPGAIEASVTALAALVLSAPYACRLVRRALVPAPHDGRVRLAVPRLRVAPSAVATARDELDELECEADAPTPSSSSRVRLPRQTAR
jgi:hypothetical protein